MAGEEKLKTFCATTTTTRKQPLQFRPPAAIGQAGGHCAQSAAPARPQSIACQPPDRLHFSIQFFSSLSRFYLICTCAQVAPQVSANAARTPKRPSLSLVFALLLLLLLLLLLHCIEVVGAHTMRARFAHTHTQVWPSGWRFLTPIQSALIQLAQLSGCSTGWPAGRPAARSRTPISLRPGERASCWTLERASGRTDGRTMAADRLAGRRNLSSIHTDWKRPLWARGRVSHAADARQCTGRPAGEPCKLAHLRLLLVVVVVVLSSAAAAALAESTSGRRHESRNCLSFSHLAGSSLGSARLG